MALLSRRRAVKPGDEPAAAVDPAPVDGDDELPAGADSTAAEAAPASDDEQPAAAADGGAKRRHRWAPRLPVVPALLVVLALLLGAGGWLWFTRPGSSPVRLDDAAGALTAARQGIVELTSFDYVTLQDDITAVGKVTTGDLRTQAVQSLQSQADALTKAEAVASTEVLGAGVTTVGDHSATVAAVISTTQKTKASDQPTVSRYRVSISLIRTGDTWLLSAIQEL